MKKTFSKFLSKMFAITFLAIMSVFTLAGCDVTDALKSNGTTGTTDSLGRRLLDVPVVRFVSSETVASNSVDLGDNPDGDGVGFDSQYIEAISPTVQVTNENTGTIVWNHTPYIHSAENVNGLVINYQANNYQIVLDGKVYYLVLNNNLKTATSINVNSNTSTQISGNNFIFSGADNTNIYNSNSNQLLTSNLNQWTDLPLAAGTDTDYYFQIAEEGSKTYSNASSNMVHIEYRIYQTKAGVEYNWNYQTNSYDYGANNTDTVTNIEYQIRFSPRLENGSTTRNFKVRRLVQSGSVSYGHSNISSTCVFNAYKMTFSVDSVNSSEIGYGELSYDADKFFFYSSTKQYNSSNSYSYLTSITGYFPEGKQVNVSRTYPGSASNTDTTNAISQNFALQSWTRNTYSNELTTKLLSYQEDGKTKFYTTADLTDAEIALLDELNTYSGTLSDPNAYILSSSHSGSGYVSSNNTGYTSTISGSKVQNSPILSSAMLAAHPSYRLAVGSTFNLTKVLRSSYTGRLFDIGYSYDLIKSQITNTVGAGENNQNLCFETLSAPTTSGDTTTAGSSTLTVVSNSLTHSDTYKANFAKVDNFTLSGTAFKWETNSYSPLSSLTLIKQSRTQVTTDSTTSWIVDEHATNNNAATTKNDGSFELKGLSIVDFVIANATATVEITQGTPITTSYNLYSLALEKSNYYSNTKGNTNVLPVTNASGNIKFGDKTSIAITATTLEAESNLNVNIVVPKGDGTYVSLSEFAGSDISYEVI